MNHTNEFKRRILKKIIERKLKNRSAFNMLRSIQKLLTHLCFSNHFQSAHLLSTPVVNPYQCFRQYPWSSSQWLYSKTLYHQHVPFSSEKRKDPLHPEDLSACHAWSAALNFHEHMLWHPSSPCFWNSITDDIATARLPCYPPLACSTFPCTKNIHSLGTLTASILTTLHSLAFSFSE